MTDTMDSRQHVLTRRRHLLLNFSWTKIPSKCIFKEHSVVVTNPQNRKNISFFFLSSSLVRRLLPVAEPTASSWSPPCLHLQNLRSVDLETVSPQVLSVFRILVIGVVATLLGIDACCFTSSPTIGCLNPMSHPRLLIESPTACRMPTCCSPTLESVLSPED